MSNRKTRKSIIEKNRVKVNNLAYTDYFLVVCHGGTINKRETRFDTKFDDNIISLDFFIEHGKELHITDKFVLDSTFKEMKKELNAYPSNTLQHWQLSNTLHAKANATKANENSDLVAKYFKNHQMFENIIKNPLITLTKTNNIFEVPAIQFSIAKSDIENMFFHSFMGIYHFTIQNQTIDKIDIVKNSEQLYAINTKNDESKITYKMFQEIIGNYMKNNNLRNNPVGIGFICCRSYVPTYDLERLQLKEKDYHHYFTFSKIDLEKQIINENKNQYILPVLIYSPVIYSDVSKPSESIFTEYLQNWPEALLSLTSQGCGLNVLAFWKIVNRTLARENVLCLPKAGTSIFRIIQHIEMFTIYRGSTKNNKYVITRKPITFLGEYLDFMMDNYQKRIIGKVPLSERGIISIIKFYRKREKSISGMDHAGHTVSFFFIKTQDGQIKCYMIDPQAKTDFLFKTNGSTPVYDYNIWINSNNFVDFDIIWIESSSSDSSAISLPHFLGEDGRIVTYNGESFGGEGQSMRYSVKSVRSNRSSVRSSYKKKNSRIRLLPPNIVMEKAEDEMNSEQIDFFMDVLKEQNK